MPDRQLDEIYWDSFNETEETILLRGSGGTVFPIAPGEREILPKQIEALNAARIYKKTLLEGGMGWGKTVVLMMILNDLLFEWATPGHRHGLGWWDPDGLWHDTPVCNVAHENVKVFLVSQTLTSIRQRHIPHFLERYGEFGTLNKNEFEFTYHEEYAGGVIAMFGTENIAKIRSVDGAAAVHEEVTLEADAKKSIDTIIKRLRWKGIDHTPWIGATNTTGPSRAYCKEEFIDKPQRTILDKKTGRVFPGTFSIHGDAYDNPHLEPDYIRALENGTDFEVKAYLLGSWDAPEGAMFKLEDGIHIVDDANYHIDETWKMCIGVDFGWEHPTVCGGDVMDPLTGQIVHNLVWSAEGKTAKQAKLEIWDYFLEAGFPIDRASVRVGDIAGSRGQTKLAASQMVNSTDWGIFNSETKHGNITLPSFRLKPAWKGRIEGWKAVREEFDYDFDWIARNPGMPMSAVNRQPFVTRAPNTVILRSCWQTRSSYTNLQAHKTRQGDHQETSGAYGPGKGDDEAVTHRYRNMAFRKRKFGGQSKRVPEMTGERHVTAQRRGRFGRELRAYQLAGGGTSGYAG